MRRRRLCVGLLLSLLCSCTAPAAESPAPAAVGTPAESDILTPEEAAVQCAQALLDSQSDGESYRLLPQEDIEFYLSEVYGIPEDSRGMAALVYTAGGVDARELAVIYEINDIAGSTAAAALEAYRQSRVGDFTGYAPDQADLVERALVMKGDIALLMICTDPDAAQRALEDKLSHLALKPYDPAEEPPEPYDRTAEVNDKGWQLFIPPNKFDMTPYDTSAILAAWETGEESGLSDKDAAILARCRTALEWCVQEDMTDFQKELNLHDWLTQEYYGCYDRTVQNPKTPLGREDNLNPYGLLVKRYGICLSYATTFQLLMDLAGVECITVVGASSDSGSDHAWNMVKLEGEWYCVDPTWNATWYGDLQGEELMKSTHRYFNVTSQEMRNSDHQWDYENVPEATATRFRWDGRGRPSSP